jgi:uncharacterized protein (TIGR03435 family)
LVQCRPVWLVLGDAASQVPPSPAGTGLQGSFDYKLEWSPDEVQLQSQESPQIDGNAPSLGAALQQQMELKLVSQTGLVNVITVEKADRPTAN